MAKVHFEAGGYGETVQFTDTQASAEYLRRRLSNPKEQANLEQTLNWQVVCRGLSLKRVRRERERLRGLYSRQQRRMWMLVQRKENARR